MSLITPMITPAHTPTPPVCAPLTPPTTDEAHTLTTTEPIYYWITPTGSTHYTRFSQEAVRNDTFNLFGCKSRTIQAPLYADRSTIKRLIIQNQTPPEAEGQGVRTPPQPPCAHL